METQTARTGGHDTPPTSEVLDGLNDLLQLDHDAVGAYEVAIGKLQDTDQASQIRGFKVDHERHIRDLNAQIAALGGTPKDKPHVTGPFKQALQSLGAIGGDKGVLMAFRTNELQVRTKYDSYASKAMLWPNEVKRLIDQNALDEERHYQWVADTLQRMGIGSGEGAEMDAATRKREHARAGGGAMDDAKARAQELGGQAREKAGHLAGAAPARIASGLERAAEKLHGTADRASGQTGGKAKAGDAAHRLAGGMEGAARYLREGDREQLRSDVEERTRQSPMQTLLIAAAAGFVIGRIIR